MFTLQKKKMFDCCRVRDIAIPHTLSVALIYLCIDIVSHLSTDISVIVHIQQVMKHVR